MPTVVIPRVPNSLNDWSRGKGHWSIRGQMLGRWKNLFVAYGAKRAARISGPVEVWITFYMPTKRRADPDNRVKHVLDAAVSCGLIEDDGPPILTALHIMARHDAASPRTEFRYESAGEPAWDPPKPRARKR